MSLFGHDDIFDPLVSFRNWQIVLQVVHHGSACRQMMGYDEINDSAQFDSTNSAKGHAIYN